MPFAVRTPLSRLTLAALLVAACATAAGAAPTDNAKHVYIIYYTPADRDPLPAYEARLDRIMTDVQNFYRTEMQRNGFGPMTFPLERDADGKLVVHLVKGTKSYAYEQQIDSGDIRAQVGAAMRKEGVDIRREHIIVFQNLIFRDGDNIRCWSPYGGSGDHIWGCAWVTDLELIELANLTKKEPMLNLGFASWPLDRYVMSQLGGVAHEFGHALGLPHNRETPKQHEAMGSALMGNGNYQYRGEVSGRSKGAFLSKPHAAILSSHPLFKGNSDQIDVRPTCVFESIRLSEDKGDLLITGKMTSNIKPYAAVAYHDPMPEHADYDASSWLSEIDNQGRFQVRICDVSPGYRAIRLIIHYVNGAEACTSLLYKLGDDGKLPIDDLNRQVIYETSVTPAKDANDVAALRAALAKLESVDDRWTRKARAVLHIAAGKETKPIELGVLGPNVREAWLSDAAWASAEALGRPARDMLPGENLPLESNGDIHEHGIYAHAPSRCVFDLGGAWKTFETSYAIQLWKDGSVVFVIKCDGVEKLRTKMIRGWDEGHAMIDVTGVKTLELIAEVAENDHWGDDAVWLSPKLTR